MDWIVWNRETRSIIDFGSESETTSLANELNKRYQTDAYVPRQYKEPLLK